MAGKYIMVTPPKLLPIKDYLSSSWLDILEAEFDEPYMISLQFFLDNERTKGKIIYPDALNWFEAFNKLTPQEVKVVILGQDPYHGPGQAHGLSFSVRADADIPPSLYNIYKELQNDIGIPKPLHGCLSSWSEQGVLLLNTSLTVEQGAPGSHQTIGWDIFTTKVIKELNAQRKNLVFLLWGKEAQKKCAFIDPDKHLILKTSHPSPLSSYRGFLGCKHFSLTNKYIHMHGQKEIDWVVLPIA